MAIGDNLSDVKTLWGVAGCVNTSKVLFTAAEKGIDVDGRSIDTNSELEMKELMAISPFGSIPCLKDIDFYIYGVDAILSYLNDKGFGDSLIPRNGIARAQMYQWINIANDHFSPATTALKNGDNSAKEKVAGIIMALAEQLTNKSQRGDYIVGEFSLADIHWAPYIHVCCLYGHESLIDSVSAVRTWWSHMKVRKSSSKEDYVAFTVLPSMDEINDNKIRSVSINV